MVTDDTTGAPVGLGTLRKIFAEHEWECVLDAGQEGLAKNNGKISRGKESTQQCLAHARVAV